MLYIFFFPTGNGYIEGTELDGFLREFVSSANTADVSPEVNCTRAHTYVHTYLYIYTYSLLDIDGIYILAASCRLSSFFFLNNIYVGTYKKNKTLIKVETGQHSRGNQNYFNGFFYYCWSMTNNKPVSPANEIQK